MQQVHVVEDEHHGCLEPGHRLDEAVREGAVERVRNRDLGQGPGGHTGASVPQRLQYVAPENFLPVVPIVEGEPGCSSLWSLAEPRSQQHRLAGAGRCAEQRRPARGSAVQHVEQTRSPQHRHRCLRHFELADEQRC
jgi:hypothetical protein